jgi:hypothetical protein
MFLTGCASVSHLREGVYDAGAFRVRYSVSGPFVPYFTHAYASPAERDDGAIFITNFVRPGFIQDHHGGGFGIYVMPSSRFANPVKTEEALTAIIPAAFHKNRLNEFVEARIERLGERSWVIAKTSKLSDQRIVTGVACYSYVNSECIVHAGWGFAEGISEGDFQTQLLGIRDILTRIKVEKAFPLDSRGSSQPEAIQASSCPVAFIDRCLAY